MPQSHKTAPRERRNAPQRTVAPPAKQPACPVCGRVLAPLRGRIRPHAGTGQYTICPGSNRAL